MGRGIRLNDIKKLRCRFAPVARHIERVESGFRELSATTPIRSPKSVPDTVSRSREFQVHIHPRARVETVRKRPFFLFGLISKYEATTEQGHRSQGPNDTARPRCQAIGASA